MIISFSLRPENYGSPLEKFLFKPILLGFRSDTKYWIMAIEAGSEISEFEFKKFLPEEYQKYLYRKK